MDYQDFDYNIKILSVGEYGVGKTSLLFCFNDDKFPNCNHPTIGTEYKMKLLDFENKIIRVELWDIEAGDIYAYKNPVTRYFKGVHGILIVYDISEKYTFNEIDHWINQIRTKASPDVRLILVGNKYDKPERKVKEEEGKKKADELGIKYFETSAKTGYNVKDAYNFLIKDIIDNHKNFKI